MSDEDTRRYRRMQALLRKTWAECEVYALSPRTEDAIARIMVKVELEGVRYGRHQVTKREHRK